MWVICNEWSKNHWCSPLNFKPHDWILTTPVQTSTVFDQSCVGLRNELRFPKYKCSVYVGMLCTWRRAACFVLLEALAEVMEASLLPDMFDNESQDYSDLKFLQNRGHQSLLNMNIVCTSTWPLILRSLRSVMQLQIIWDMAHGVVSTHKVVIVSEGFKILLLYLLFFFIVHRVFMLIPLKKTKNTFTHRCFVLSPTFLQHDVFCLICWDKSGLETPASVAECERRKSFVSPSPPEGREHISFVVFFILFWWLFLILL